MTSVLDSDVPRGAISGSDVTRSSDDPFWNLSPHPNDVILRLLGYLHDGRWNAKHSKILANKPISTSASTFAL